MSQYTADTFQIKVQSINGRIIQRNEAKHIYFTCLKQVLAATDFRALCLECYHKVRVRVRPNFHFADQAFLSVVHCLAILCQPSC